MNRKKIPTRTNRFIRFLDDHQWLPLAIVIVLLVIVNSPPFN